MLCTCEDAIGKIEKHALEETGPVLAKFSVSRKKNVNSCIFTKFFKEFIIFREIENLAGEPADLNWFLFFKDRNTILL